LGPAANLLAYQVDKRLDGIAKAEVSTRLAAIYLMDHKPQPAIDILHVSQISGLPDDVGHQRLLLEARAFAALKQWNNALDLVGVDDAADTAACAPTFMGKRQLEVAGQKAEELLDTRWSDAAPLSDSERGQVLRMAVGLFAGQRRGRTRPHPRPFHAQDEGHTGRSAFAVLTQSIDLHSLAFRDAATQIASVGLAGILHEGFRQAPRSRGDELIRGVITASVSCRECGPPRVTQIPPSKIWSAFQSVRKSALYLGGRIRGP